MAKMVTLKIDDREVSVPAGTLIVNAAKEIGNDIPVFCYHPKMEPVGMCRMCLVEIGRPAIDRATGKPQLNPDGSPVIQFGPKLDTACTTPVSEGMQVRTSTRKVIDAREDVLEFLLTSHPLDCPICDKGGECPLQNLTMAHGPGKSRFLFDEKIHLAKHYPLGDLIYLDRERCIQCARCIRFQDEIADDRVIGFSQRGRSLEIVTFSEPGFDSYFSGNTTDICPVGALTTADFRFGARPWELKVGASICTQCPVGCNLAVNVRREATSGKWAVKRVMPRQNEEVNEIWICDKGRFTYHFAESPDRITHPLIKRDGALVEASWDEALDLAAKGLQGQAANLVTLAGGSLSNEDLFNLRQLTHSLGGKTVQYGHMAGGEWAAQVGLAQGSNLGALGAETAILVVACDLQEEAPVWFLRVKQAAARGAKLIVVNPRQTKLERYAKHVVRFKYGEEVSALQPFKPGAEVAEEAKAALDALSGAENLVIFFGSEGLGVEGTRDLAQACAGLLAAYGKTGKPNNGLVGVWEKANNQGAFDLGFIPETGLAQVLSEASALLIAAADPAGEDPALAQAVDSAGFVVVQELFLTETARRADVVLPAQSFIEREGTFTSGERRVQRFYPAVAPIPEARADYVITAQIGKRLNLPLQAGSAALVMLQIAQLLPEYAGLSYTTISATRPQTPMIGRADLFYGGTAYENRQGLGVQLPSGALSAGWHEAGVQTTAPITPQAGEALVVPVTRLYDQGASVTPSVLLHPRMARVEARMNSKLMDAFGLQIMDIVLLPLNGNQYRARVVCDDTLPDGVVTLPRSVGVPLWSPQAVKIQRLVEEPAAQAVKG